MSQKRATSKREFLEEAGLDNYVEYSLDGEDAVLVSDVEGDGNFMPYISTSEKYGEEDTQKIDELLNSENLINYHSVFYDEKNSNNKKGSVFHVEGSSLP